MGSNYIITPDGDFVSKSELYHHGTLGMKWGVRRYQNPDGTLTAAGRKRYIGSDGNLTKAGKKYYSKETERLKNERKKLTAQKRTEAKLSKLELLRSENNSLKGQTGDKKNSAKNGTSKKSLKDMTDDEIRKAIDRKRLEDDYKRAYPDPPSKTEKLNKFMDKMLNEAIIPATVNAGKNALNKWAEGVLKTKVDPNSYEALKKEYDKLSIKKKLDDLKAGKDPDKKEPTWDEKLKEQQYKANEEKARREAEERAKKASDSGSSNSSNNSSGTTSNNTQSQNKSQNQTQTQKKKNKNKNENKNENSSSSKTVYEGTVEGTGRNSWTGWGNSSNTSSNTRKGSSVVDARSDDTVNSTTTAKNTSAGRSAISGYLDSPISGLLPAPKDRDI